MTEESSEKRVGLVASLWDPVDNSSMTLFRVCFGLVMANWGWDYLASGRVTRLYVEPKFHFTYYMFDWVQPWSGSWMYIHFVVLIVTALFIAVGFFYRFSATVFAIGFSYFFLLDMTNYQNHYYFICLIATWLPFMPLHRNVSVDAWIRPAIRSQVAPKWALWMLRFHVALPYFFGGVAKLLPDWLQGEPLSQILEAKSTLPFIGPILANHSMAIVLAWSALAFDLAIVPLLMWKRTRLIACCLCATFHLLNSVIFNIHVFPWMMLLVTPIFFEPNLPRLILGGQALDLTTVTQQNPVYCRTLAHRIAFSMMIVYVVFHCVWPLRYRLYSGDASWTEKGHTFAWRMMLRGKTVVLGYAIQDKITGKVSDGSISRFINAEQSDRFGRDPEMILHFAHFLGEDYRKKTGNPASVYALVLASLNGRKPALLIDPNVDLMDQLRGFHDRPWVLPLREPLRRPTWKVPLDQWKQQVDIPELRFLKKR